MPEAPTEDSLTHEEAIMLLCTKKLFLQQRRTRMPLHQRRGRFGGLDSLKINFQNELPGPTPQNGDHNDCNSKITSTNPKWMAKHHRKPRERKIPGYLQVGSRECSHVERDRTDAGAHCRLGLVFYLWIGWMLHRLGNRKLLLCSPVGLEERNGMF